jgi:photosystem II stability/assembly factor-like uncharacterized protein
MRLALSLVTLLWLIVQPVPAQAEWTPTNGPNGGCFSYFVFPPGAPSLVFASGGYMEHFSGLYRSTDGGASWELQIMNDRVMVGRLVADPWRPGRLLFGGSAYYGTGFFESTDMGVTWVTMTDALAFGPDDLVVDRETPNTIYGIASGGYHMAAGVFKSTDGGRTWARKAILAHPRLAGADLEIDPSDSQSIYAMLGNGRVYKSVNGGETWRQSSKGLPGYEKGVHSIAINPVDPRTLYSAGREGIYKTTNGGTNWFTTDCHCSAREIDIDPGNPSVVYAAGRAESGLEQAVKSTDGGKSWRRLSLPRFDVHPYTAIAVDPRNPEHVFAASEARGILKSANGGMTWRRSMRNVRLPVYSLSADLGHAGHMMAVGGPLSKKIVFETFNGGAFWRWVPVLDSYNVSYIAIHPRNGNVMAAVADWNLLVSSDAGKHWDIRDQVENVYLDPSQSNTMYAFFGWRDFRKSTDLGRSWVRLGLPLRAYESVEDVAINPRQSSILYVATLGSTDEEDPAPARLFRSTNGGATWKDITGGGLPQVEIFSEVEINWKAPRTVYVIGSLVAGASTVLCRSTDGGDTWAQLTASFPGSRLSVDRFNSQRLLSYRAGDYGLYLSQDGGRTWHAIETDGLFSPGRLYIERGAIGTALFDPWRAKRIFAAVDGVKRYGLP